MAAPVYRIIDANFNRAREALRVIEDFCRFALSSTQLTTCAKQLRHALSAAVAHLDPSQLIAARDSLGDVGAGKTVDNQLQRNDLRDCFTAACKRLSESLRCLAEMTQTLNPEVAQTIENLRFTAYNLEKDIFLFADATEKFKSVRLYVIISSNLPADVISLTHQCVTGGADCVQLRAKDIEDAQLFALALEFTKICKDSGVLAIINDRVDIAVTAGADGGHLGQDDLPIEQARKLQTTPLIVGKSTHSIEQLHAACSELPTYVSLGPVSATATKPTASPVGLDYVKQGIAELADTGIAHVAVGGITLENIKDVLNAGAKTIAVCSAVTESADPARACKKLKEKICCFK
ncbi:MAG: thiamine phosphate synthase [Sedimentisphaerales bacterium]|nr:thiamine phosphate synthase [Sedimentisphaerales bacterium]